MASRENQGLQITLMISFGVILVMAVLCYFLYKNFDEKKRELASAQEEVNAKRKAALEVQEERNELAKLIGFSAEDTNDTIRREYEKDMGIYAVGFSEERKGYRQVLKYVHFSKEQAIDSLVTSEQRERELKDKLAAVEAAKQKQLVEFRRNAEASKKELGVERTKFAEQRDRITQDKDRIAAKLSQQENKNQADTTKFANAERLYKKKITEQRLTIEDQAKKILEFLDETFDVADGRITLVDQGSGTVWVNLGSADGLKPQLRFSVYAAGDDADTLAESKGSIEITRIVNERAAEGRIVRRDESKPIIRGDQIDTPLFNRGKRDGYAFSGFLDIDGDGKSDRQVLHDLIRLYGGVVDAEQLDDGSVKGEVKLTTRYLIVGLTPTVGEAADGVGSANLVEGFTQLRNRAQDLGVQTLELSKFIERTGWRPERRTIPLGPAARSEDFPAHAPEGVGTSETFKRRRRPRAK